MYNNFQMYPMIDLLGWHVPALNCVSPKPSLWTETAPESRLVDPYAAIT